MSTLVIIGASGHGKVVADAALAAGPWKELLFLDSHWPSLSKVGPWSVIGSDQDHPFEVPMPFIVAIGSASVRLRLQHHYQYHGWTAQTIVHPAAYVSPYALVSPGSFIAPGAVVGPFATLGEACIVNTGASVDHDCRLGEGVHIAPGAHLAGDVAVGARTCVGIGASVIQGLSLSSDIMVGAGAAVVGNLREPGLYVGVPARRKVKGR